MRQIDDYNASPGFNIGGFEYLKGDIVAIHTYDGKQYHGKIDNIYWWGFGNRQGIAIDVQNDDGAIYSLDDVEIRYMQWLGC